MSTRKDPSTSLVHSPKSGFERATSRLTVGHLLAGTLIGGALMGSALTKICEEPQTERVIPSIVFNWNAPGADLRMEAASAPENVVRNTDQCEPGAFLGIEFRRDDSFARLARWHRQQRDGFFHLNRPFAHAVHHASGVTILNVLHGTSAETMGLLPGDVIVEMDDMAVRSAAQLAAEIRERCVGERTRFRIHRGDQVKILHGTLRSRLDRGCHSRK